MPIYEYECQACGCTFSALIMRVEEESSLCCSKCGENRLRKLISRVAFHLSESDRLARYDPGARQTESFFKDSRNIGLSAKKKAQQMGVDLGPSFESKVEKLRTDPSSVIKDAD